MTQIRNSDTQQRSSGKVATGQSLNSETTDNDLPCPTCPDCLIWCLKVDTGSPAPEDGPLCPTGQRNAAKHPKMSQTLQA